jgi:hypothetical protein
MTTDFRKAFVDLLTNHTIHYLPEQHIIDQNGDVAELIWKNYSPPSEYYWDEESEHRVKKDIAPEWGIILGAYKQNTQFWGKAFESNNSYEMLLDKDFKISFPFISSFWLSDDSKLLLAFEKTKNKIFTDLINDTTTKEETYKNYLLSNIRNVKSEDIKRFQNDKNFVVNVLSQYPSLYSDMNESNKHNHDYIKLALRLKDNLKEIPEKYQNNAAVKDFWFRIHTNYFDSKDIIDFNDDEKRKLFKERLDFLGSLLSHKAHSIYKKYAVELLSADIGKYINKFGVDIIKSLKSDLFESEKFKDDLKSLVKNYNNTEPNSKTDDKIFALIKDKVELTNIIENNLFYIFKEKRLSKKLIDSEEYNQWIQTILEKNHQNEITSDESRSLINALKKITQIEALKELPRTKDLFTYYQHERLSALLPTQDKKTSKMKI